MSAATWDDIVTFDCSGMKSGDPFISISKSCTITLSANFVRKADKSIKYSTHALLSYSAGNSAVIFTFTSDGDTPGAYKITKGVNLSIAARSFFNFFELDPSQLNGRYIPEEVDIPKLGKRWAIFLNKKTGTQ